jgi:hypothetical protein
VNQVPTLGWGRECLLSPYLALNHLTAMAEVGESFLFAPAIARSEAFTEMVVVRPILPRQEACRKAASVRAIVEPSKARVRRGSAAAGLDSSRDL